MIKTLLHEIKNFDDFVSTCNHFDIEINNNQLNLFKKYYEILLEWNEKINLISRRNNIILEKHFLDSILFLPEIQNLVHDSHISLLDIGSGGGFPAIPLAIMNPSWQFVLCESTKKKANFLTHLVKELDLEKNVKVVNARVETIQKTRNQKFDLITARAISKLDVLIKYALPLLKKNGSLLAYKAKNIDDEIKSTENLIKKNNLKLTVFSKGINEVERKLIVLTHF